MVLTAQRPLSLKSAGQVRVRETDLRGVLAQQMVFWGLDARHPDGNLFLRTGFTRLPRPREGTSSRYRRELPGGSVVELHGTYLRWETEGRSFVFKRGSRRLGEVSSWDPANAESNPLLPVPAGEWSDLARPLLQWALVHEESVQTLAGESWRDFCWKKLKSLPLGPTWAKPESTKEWFRRASRPWKSNGFTLVELLVAITIIAVLAAGIWTAFARAKMMANRAACASNMRTLGTAFIAYANENSGWLPTTSHLDPGESWIFQLKDYLGDGYDRIRICPADPKREDRLAEGGTSYTLNEYTSVDLDDGLGGMIESFRHLPRLQYPSQTPLLFTVADRVGLSFTNDHTHSRNWKSWSSVLADISPDRHRTGEATPQHLEGSANYLYADGRVETIKAADLKAQWFDRGINFAMPPEARPTGQP
ncbi:MAG: type II secretion system protein [Verrucomicrobiales bacterium]